MPSAPSRPFGAAFGLLCCVLALGAAPASAQDAAAFKVLKLDGQQVRWPLPPNGGPRVVTYRLVTGTMQGNGGGDTLTFVISEDSDATVIATLDGGSDLFFAKDVGTHSANVAVSNLEQDILV